MAETGTQWSATSGHLKVGVNVRYDAVGAGTTSSHVYADFYVQTQAWGFGSVSYPDSQTISFGGSLSGSWNYGLYSAYGATVTLFLGTYDLGAQATSYSGGPTFRFYGAISGAYDGSAPVIDYWWSLPARPASVPSAPPTTVDSVTANSARVVVSAAAENGSTILEYEAQVDNNSDFSSPISTWSGGTGTVSGLAPATNHYARARARNAVGWGAYSSTVTFTTSASVPGVPTAFASNTIGQTTANLTWTAPSNGGSAILNYTVQLATDSGFTQNLQTLTFSGSPAALTGLVPGTLYYARVCAVNAVGAGSYTSAITFTTLAGTPVIITPSSGSTRTDGMGYAVVEALGIVAGRLITIEFSKSSTFASGIQTMTLTATGPSGDNRYTVASTSVFMDNGTWYVRAKVTNTGTGYVTPWSTIVSFTQTHTPAALALSPTAGVVVQYQATTFFTWRFIDSASPNDYQASYRLVIQNNSSGAIVYDSGKIASISYLETTIGRAISSSLKNVTLRWQVMVWDRSDQPSAYTGWNLFTLSDPPVVTIVTPPAGLPVDTGAPTFSWTTSIPSGGTQASAIVRVYDSGTNALVWEKTVTGSGTSVTPPVVILANEKAYHFTVGVTDTNNLTGTAQGSFTTSYTAPDSVAYAIQATDPDGLGYVEISWPSANADALFTEWKVYRRSLIDTDWELQETISDQNIRSYLDYMLIAGETYSYSVTQVAMRSGVALESPVGFYVDGNDVLTETREYQVDLTNYWLINTVSPEMSLEIPNVTSDPSTLEIEKATYTLVGRGRHVDYGDDLGYAGTITCQIRVPERRSEFKQALEDLRKSRETCYLRTPFGKLFQVALGDSGWNPLAGTGTMEMGDMSIPYEEVN